MIAKLIKLPEADFEELKKRANGKSNVSDIIRSYIAVGLDKEIEVEIKGEMVKLHLTEALDLVRELGVKLSESYK